MKNDYILDIVENIGKGLGGLIFDIEDDSEPIVIENLSDKDMAIIILKRFVLKGNYNQGENFLFELAEKGFLKDLREIGKWFYDQLLKKTDEELKKGNFSKEEIEKGLKDFYSIIEK